MHIVAQTPTSVRDYTVVSASPVSTLGELARAIAVDDGSGLVVVDGEPISIEIPLREVDLVPGSVIADPTVAEPLRAHRHDRDPEAVHCGRRIELGVAGGWDASHRITVPAGEHVIGEPIATGAGAITIDLVAEHRFIVGVDDHATTIRPIEGRGVAINGQTASVSTRFDDGVAIVNRTGFSVLPERGSQPARLTEHTRTGPVLFNRPPRTVPDQAQEPIDLPARPEQNKAARKLSIAMMLAPLPVGALMVLAFRRWIFAIFMLMTPVMALARWAEGRRNAKKDRLRFEAEMAEAISTSVLLLNQARVVEETRRRRVQPDIAELRRRAELGAPSLWERQLADDDYLTVSFGWADVPWQVPTTADVATFPELAGLFATQPPLQAVPLTVDIDESIAVGIVGSRVQALAVARSAILQAVTLSGPADVELLIVVEEHRLADWDWTKWLPHLAGVGGQARVAVTAVAASAEVEDLLEVDTSPGAHLRSKERTEPVRLVVLDHDEIATAAASPIRAVLRDQLRARAIVLTDNADSLPRSCGSIVTVADDLSVTLHEPATNTTVFGGLPAAVSAESAAEWARSLARYADPDAGGASAAIPSSITLTALRDGRELADPQVVLDRWRSAATDPSPAAVIGSASFGLLDIDLVRDGPHGLIAGTTGSGKSELLRTMVTSMAANVSPDHLNFVLVDFKGGGAFDLCAALPHVVSVVTDLDEHLAARALRCLKAELRYREERLREVTASDISEYLERSTEPLPRLVVIIDEFATLAAELPDFLTSLVDIAQRGRSLGVHMILATQRPSGVIDKKIKANTNLRIALRVQDVNDSDDVIGTRQAASLGRGQPGRAFARFGSSEIVEFQTAIVSTPSRAADEIELQVIDFGFDMRPGGRRDEPTSDDPTDAEMYVEALTIANDRGGYRPARVPWPDPLPTTLDIAGFTEHGPSPRCAPIGLTDLPEEQRQEVTWWSPERGNTLLYGVSAQCLSQSLASLAIGLAQRNSADDLHLYVLDYGNRSLAPLNDLPHCGANIGVGQSEQTDRLIDLLEVEMQRRRVQPEVVWPMIVLIVDNYASVLESFEERGNLDGATRLASILRDGPGLGVFTFASSMTERGVPLRVASGIESKLILRMGDPSAYVVFGLAAKEVPTMGALRAIDALSKLEMQLFGVADLPKAVADINDGAVPPRRPPLPVRVLESQVDRSTLSLQHGAITSDEWVIPVGVLASNLRTGLLSLPAGEHAIIAGGPRSGRSAALVTIGESVAELDSSVTIVAVTPRRSALADHPAIDVAIGAHSTLEQVESAVGQAGPLLILIDDVESLPAELVPPLAALLTVREDNRHIIAGGRTDTFRSASSWCRPIRESRSGIILNPAPTDGDIHKTQLPMRRPEAFPPGRGFVINQGLPERIQVAEVGVAPRPEPQNQMRS